MPDQYQWVTATWENMSHPQKNRRTISSNSFTLISFQHVNNLSRGMCSLKSFHLTFFLWKFQHHFLLQQRPKCLSNCYWDKTPSRRIPLSRREKHTICIPVFLSLWLAAAVMFKDLSRQMLPISRRVPLSVIATSCLTTLFWGQAQRPARMIYSQSELTRAETSGTHQLITLLYIWSHKHRSSKRLFVPVLVVVIAAAPLKWVQPLLFSNSSLSHF